MSLTPRDEKILQNIAYKIEDAARELKEFRQNRKDLQEVMLTTEYRTLLTMFSRLKRELDSIP